VKVISPEIPIILEADVLCVTEGSNHSTANKQRRSWDIAEGSATRQGDVSPAGSKTAAWYQMETIGNRETQDALTKGVCDIKPINDKILQTVFRESDHYTYPRVSASTVAPVDVAHTYGSRHTWRSAFHRRLSAFICVHLRLISVLLSDITQKIQFELFTMMKKLPIISCFSKQNIIKSALRGEQ